MNLGVRELGRDHRITSRLPLHGKFLELLSQGLLAAFTNPHAETLNGITMYASDAFNAANAFTLAEHGDGCDFLFGGKCVCHLRR